jgi:hypothetical protein
VALTWSATLARRGWLARQKLLFWDLARNGRIAKWGRAVKLSGGRPE